MPDYKCVLCGDTFQFGPHVYNGEYLSNYKMPVCRSCLRSNWDGVAPDYEDVFEAHLKANSIPPPQRNAKGWYPLK